MSQLAWLSTEGSDEPLPAHVIEHGREQRRLRVAAERCKQTIEAIHEVRMLYMCRRTWALAARESTRAGGLLPCLRQLS